MNDKIVLIDGLKRYKIIHDPELKDRLFYNLDIYKFGSEELDGLYIKKLDNPPINMLEYNKEEALYLIKSPLYKNVYYSIDKFYECYKSDFKDLIKNISKRMGAKSIEIIFHEEEIYIENLINKLKLNAKLEACEADACAGLKKGNEISINSDKKSDDIYRENIEMEINLSKEEFKKWFDNEQINIYGLGDMKSRVQDFLDYGQIGGDITIEKFEFSSVMNAFQSYLDIGAKFNVDVIPDFLQTAFKSSFNFSSEKSINKELKYSKSSRIFIKF